MLVICGKSGTGKTTIAKILEDKYNMNRIIGYTTRPMREGEENYVDYIFENEYEWKLHDDELFVETSFPPPNGGEPWRYGVLTDKIINADFYTLFVANPAEVKRLIKDKIDCTIILLDASSAVLKRRMIQHNDSDWIARYERDKKDFDIEIINNSFVVPTNNGTPEEIADYIYKEYLTR